jgi:hypothetical protein
MAEGFGAEGIFTAVSLMTLVQATHIHLNLDFIKAGFIHPTLLRDILVRAHPKICLD